jgi:hypothetical protein
MAQVLKSAAMKMLMAFLFLFLIASGKARAEESKGMDILPKCKAALAGDAGYSVGRCHGFIEGVIAGMYIAGPSGESFRQSNIRQGYCFPEESTNEQVVAVFVKYLEDHPAKLHEPAGMLLLNSLRIAFRCKK